MSNQDDGSIKPVEAAGFLAGCLGGGTMAIIFGPIGLIILVFLLIRSC